MEYQPSFGFDALATDMAQPRHANGLFACVMRQKLLVGILTIGIAAAATAALFVVPKVFTAGGSLIIDPVGPEAVNLGRVVPEAPIEQNTVSSEVEILNSRKLLESVVTQLDLVSNPEFNLNLRTSAWSALLTTLSHRIGTWLNVGWIPAGGASEPQNQLDDTIANLRQHLEIAQVGQSRVISVSYSSHDRDMSARIVNTLMESNLNEHLHVLEQANAKAHNWILQRLNDLRVRADQSAGAAESYRAARGLTRGRDTTLLQEEITHVNAALSAARQQRDQAASVLRDAESAKNSGDWDHLGPVLASPLIQRLREQEALAAARLAETSSRDGPDSPMVAPVKAQLAGVQRIIVSETRRIADGLRDRLAIAKADEDASNSRLDALKLKIAQMDRDLIPMTALERQATVDRDLYTSFLSRSKETDPWLEYPAARLRILSLASIPVRASFPNKTIALPAALAVSLALAIVVALLVESRRLGFVSMNDVNQNLGVPPLGLIPLSRRRGILRNGVFCEAISHLFVFVCHQGEGEGAPPRSILITSAVPGEGKSTTALALAREGVSRGLKVLLIDGDLRSRSLSTRSLSDSSAPGLADVLRGAIGVDAAVRHSAEMGVDFLPAGGRLGSPAHLLGLPSLQTIIRAVESRYDIIFIDAPPVLAGVDAWLLGRAAGTTVLLTRWRETSIKRAALAVKLLTMNKTKLAGVVLSMVNVKENAQYDHGDAILYSRAMSDYYSESAPLADRQVAIADRRADPAPGA